MVYMHDFLLFIAKVDSTRIPEINDPYVTKKTDKTDKIENQIE